MYHKYPARISTILDMIAGFAVSLYLIIKNDIDIIHVRGATPGIVCLLLPKIFKFKLIFDTRGLLAEEYDPVAGRQLGNFPQAFSHLGLINTARNLTQREKPAAVRAEAGGP